MGIGKLFEKKEPSVYCQVIGAIDAEGHLSPGWSLPDDSPPNKLRFAPGGMDGIGIYHMAESDMTEAVDTLIELLKGARPDAKTRRRLSDFLEEERTLHLIDPLSERLCAGETNLAAERIYPIAYDLMMNAGDIESVKLGIGLLGLMDVGDNQECRDAIFQLGKYDEFTLYSIIAMSGWDDGAELTFSLAREVHGWGKIHAVERLDPTLPGIKDWMIRSGCTNGVVDAYLGHTCAIKGDMIAYLREPEMEPDVFSGISVIVSALLDEGPVHGISIYEHAEEALTLYLRHAVKLCDSLCLLSVVFEVEDWLKDCDFTSKDALLALCGELAGRDGWNTEIIATINNEDTQDLFFACKAAERLDIDVAEPLIGRVGRSPIECAGYLWALRKYPEVMETMIALYERTLPLSEIASGMGDSLGLGPEFKAHGALDWILQELGPYPGKGIPLVKAGLGSSVVRNRNGACHVLNAWLETDWEIQSAPELVALVRDTAAKEVNDDLKKRLESIEVYK